MDGTQMESLQVHTKFHANNLKLTDHLGDLAYEVQ
jgi:hypothetical protein